MSTLVLVIRKRIRAAPQRVFDAWTKPEQLMKWWGPKSVVCTAAEIDLRVNGHYRIANQFPDGTMVWISGQFKVIERPARLVYTWCVGPQGTAAECVTVNFLDHGAETEIILTHELISAPAARDQHERGWVDCLEGLTRYFIVGTP